MEDPARHSTGGYLTVESYPYNDRNSLLLIEAWKDLGIEEVDHNSREQIGVSHYQTTNIHGARQSSNGAFIRPIRGRRENFVVRPNTLVTKVIIDPKTKRATGVEYSESGDRKVLKRVYARKEVILSAGVFDSPKLLMLSGIGHSEELERAGIKVVQDLPVGDNLQDHVHMPSSVAILHKMSSTVVDVSEMQNDAAYWLSTHEGINNNYVVNKILSDLYFILIYLSHYLSFLHIRKPKE